jgi:hypothetical protein
MVCKWPKLFNNIASVVDESLQISRLKITLFGVDYNVIFRTDVDKLNKIKYVLVGGSGLNHLTQV